MIVLWLMILSSTMYLNLSYLKTFLCCEILIIIFCCCRTHMCFNWWKIPSYNFSIVQKNTCKPTYIWTLNSDICMMIYVGVIQVFEAYRLGLAVLVSRLSRRLQLSIILRQERRQSPPTRLSSEKLVSRQWPTSGLTLPQILTFLVVKWNLSRF